MLAGPRFLQHIGAMRDANRWAMCLLCLVALGCHAEAGGVDARTRLAAVLRDSLGAKHDPNVSFLVHGEHQESHLYLTFDTTLVPNVPDSLFGRRARDIAQFSMRHYEKASELDSITVAAREPMQPGAWRVVHSRAFSVASLRAPVTTTLPAASPGRSPAVAEACDAYSKIFSASATAAGISTGEVGSPRDTVLSFGDLQGERAEPACLVAWNDDSTRVAPLEDVFTRATAAGWTERDHLLSADVPDGSVLAFSRGDVACVIRGSWDGGDDSDSTYVPSPGFVISASCFANRPDRY